MDRRSFIQFLTALSAATSSGFLWPQKVEAAQPDLEVELKAVQESISIFPGPRTNVWQFKGQVKQGDPTQLQAMKHGWLGPIFRVRRGQRIRVRFKNLIPQESIVHWHGLHVSPGNDGHPKMAVPAAGEYVYDFVVANRAGSYWYHPHPHRLTGPQVYGGMAGLFLISDQEEQALGLPSGEPVEGQAERVGRRKEEPAAPARMPPVLAASRFTDTR